MKHASMFKPGDSFEHYVIRRLIGVGFMGEVYEAVDKETGTIIAIKCLQTRHVEDAMMVERARREAMALSEIRHANIVHVFEVGVTDTGIVWMSMELLVGRSLRHVMKQHGHLAVGIALHYACEIADGVDAAHEFSIVHRDLKPENVFVTESQEIRVLDLGTAKFFGQGIETTGRAQVFGTVPYMSPEHLAGERVDARTDIYALGMMLYEMLAGKHPFAAHFESIIELGRAQMFQMPRPLTNVIPGLPAFVWTLVEKAIEKDREARYLSMSDFANAMRGVRKRLGKELGEHRESRPSIPAYRSSVPSERQHYVPPHALPSQRDTPASGDRPSAPRDAAPPPASRLVRSAPARVSTPKQSPGAGAQPFMPVIDTLKMAPDDEAMSDSLGPYGTIIIADPVCAQITSPPSGPAEREVRRPDSGRGATETFGNRVVERRASIPSLPPLSSTSRLSDPALPLSDDAVHRTSGRVAWNALLARETTGTARRRAAMIARVVLVSAVISTGIAGIAFLRMRQGPGSDREFGVEYVPRSVPCQEPSARPEPKQALVPPARPGPAPQNPQARQAIPTAQSTMTAQPMPGPQPTGAPAHTIDVPPPVAMASPLALGADSSPKKPAAQKPETSAEAHTSKPVVSATPKSTKPRSPPPRPTGTATAPPKLPAELFDFEG